MRPCGCRFARKEAVLVAAIRGLDLTGNNTSQAKCAIIDRDRCDFCHRPCGWLLLIVANTRSRCPDDANSIGFDRTDGNIAAHYLHLAAARAPL